MYHLWITYELMIPSIFSTQRINRNCTQRLSETSCYRYVSFVPRRIGYPVAFSRWCPSPIIWSKLSRWHSTLWELVTHRKAFEKSPAPSLHSGFQGTTAQRFELTLIHRSCKGDYLPQRSTKYKWLATTPTKVDGWVPWPLSPNRSMARPYRHRCATQGNLRVSPRPDHLWLWGLLFGAFVAFPIHFSCHQNPLLQKNHPKLSPPSLPVQGIPHLSLDLCTPAVHS